MIDELLKDHFRIKLVILLGDPSKWDRRQQNTAMVDYILLKNPTVVIRTNEVGNRWHLIIDGIYVDSELLYSITELSVAIRNMIEVKETERRNKDEEVVSRIMSSIITDL